MSISPPTKNQVGRGAIWSVFGEGAAQVLSLMLFLILARIISKEGFGIVAASLAIVEFVRRVAVDPFALSLTAKPNATKEDYDICFTSILLSSLLIAIVIAMLAGTAAKLLHIPSLTAYLRTLALLVLGMSLARTHAVWLARHLQFRVLALRSIGSVVFGGLVGVTMALTGYNVWSLVGQQLAISFASVLTLWLATPWRPNIIVLRSNSRESLRQSLYISASAFWNYIVIDSDVLFVSAFLGPAAAGVYNVAKRILLAATLMLVNAISVVVLSSLANIEDAEQRSSAFASTSSIVSLVTAPAFAGLAATAPQLIPIILGPRWAEAIPLIIILSVNGYLLSIGQLATSILLISRKSHFDTICSIFAALVSLALFFIAAHIGLEAFAVSVSLATAITFPVRVTLALRCIGMRWRGLAAVLIPSIMGSAIMFMVITLVNRLYADRLAPLSMLLISICIGPVIYGAAVSWLSPSLFQDALARGKAVIGKRRLGHSSS